MWLVPYQRWRKIGRPSQFTSSPFKAKKSAVVESKRYPARIDKTDYALAGVSSGGTAERFYQALFISQSRYLTLLRVKGETAGTAIPASRARVLLDDSRRQGAWQQLSRPLSFPKEPQYGVFTRPSEGYEQGGVRHPDLCRAAPSRSRRPSGGCAPSPRTALCRPRRASRIPGTKATRI